ncbi:RadC protein [[Mannheimia] succiniciproducens MBEL55E]|uniref:RadC protein n=1 Tax=Mannheimia succiniciproducens (strain KCTC 0769BP / MBEL55E) TaxID=221988 RepID=Q65R63_MANSM|nr:RadC protein [[Mannheimia] succiniciproducens MBEL55E]
MEFSTQSNPSIKNKGERLMLQIEKENLMPREKLLKFGANTLDNKELLAIFLRTGIKNCPVMQLSEAVLTHFGSLRQLINADRHNFAPLRASASLNLSNYRPVRK